MRAAHQLLLCLQVRRVAKSAAALRAITAAIDKAAAGKAELTSALEAARAAKFALPAGSPDQSPRFLAQAFLASVTPSTTDTPLSDSDIETFYAERRTSDAIVFATRAEAFSCSAVASPKSLILQVKVASSSTFRAATSRCTIRRVEMYRRPWDTWAQ